MNIKFGNKEAYDAFIDALRDDFQGRDPRYKGLADCLMTLLAWGYNSDAIIAKDFCDKSFTFSEVYPDGRQGLFGGIIRHESYKDGKPTGLHYYGIHT